MTLALRRNPGQSVLLQTKDGLIQVKVRTNKDGQITLAIDAPESVTILRDDAKDVKWGRN